MLARLRKSAENKDSGFTLIELLVVMIIIGILAAIAIPAFLNQKKKAIETAAKSDATNVSKEIAAALVDGPWAAVPTLTLVAGTQNYTLSTRTSADAAPVTSTVKASANVTLSLVAAASVVTESGYCVVGTPKDGQAWSAGPNGLSKNATCA